MAGAPFQRHRRDALELLADARVALLRQDRTRAADEVQDARDQLATGKVTAAVFGEFKRGKSRLLGALVEQPDLFPSEVDIATNLVTTLEYAPAERLTAFVGDDAGTSPVPIDRSEIRDYVTERGNPENTRRVRLLRIQAPIPRLESGLVLVDTPGAGGLNTEHTAITYGFIASADVAIFVLDALTPLTVEELQLLDTVARQAQRLLVVVTKIDKVAAYETVVQNTRTKLAEVLGAERGRATPVIPVSSAAKLDWLATGDEESLEVSNFPAFEAELWGLLADHGGAILVTRALGRLVRALDDLRAPLSAELVGLTGAIHEVEEAAADLQAQRDQLALLAKPDAGWRRTVVEEFDQIRATARSHLDREFDQIIDDADKSLAQPEVMNRAQSLLATIERDVSAQWSALVLDMRRRVAVLSDQIEAATGVRPNPVLSEGGVLTAFDSFGRRDQQQFDDAGGGYVALEWIGNILSVVMGDLAPYVITQIVSFFGVRSARSKQQQEAFAEDVRDQIRRAHRELRVRLAGLLDAAEAALARHFDAVIEADDARLDTARHALDARQGNARQPRVAAIRAALDELDRLRSRATAIVGEVTGPDRRLPPS